MKKILALSSLMLIVSLSGCSANDITSDENTNGVENSQDENNDNAQNQNQEVNALVVYFSATGNTKEVASIISSYISAPLFELEPVDPYTSEDLNYNSSDSRVSIERNDPNHITELVTTRFEGFDEADYIFLGAPVWRGEMSWVIKDFVLSNDFSNKTIIPFATASSSNFSLSALTQLTGDTQCTWLEGRRFRISEISEATVESWIDSLGINF